MHFVVRAVDPAAFDQFVAQTKQSGRALDRAAYEALANPGTSQPITYGSVQPGLFDDIATLKIPPSPGPAPAISPKTAEK